MTRDIEILASVSGRVCTITFNRPDKLNAWTPSMEDGLREQMEKAVADVDVRAIVLTGAGRGFCAGADMAALAAAPQPSARTAGGDRAAEDRFAFLRASPKPLVAAINGAAAGVGLCIALFCDVRFVAKGAKITAAFSRRGLVAEHGSGWLLPRLIGPMNAADLLLSGRIVAADEAERLGLARALPAEGFLEAVQAYAADLADLASPRSVAIIKRQLRDAWSQTLGDATREAAREVEACRDTDDFREGVAHFVEKRRPAFSGR